MPRSNRTPRNSQRQSPSPTTPPRTPRIRRASPKQIEIDLHTAAAQKEKEHRRNIRIASLERRAAREKEKEQDALHRHALNEMVTSQLNRSGDGNSIGNGTNEQPSRPNNNTPNETAEQVDMRLQEPVGPQV
ncbi:hypothetical protein NLI96_g10228 [Meripilus lineatus]|uniref:Uncharacterized protein n=1 Tax=Meripilus lineatus TaxID=2056292 RepID=A0AAD5UYL0_9APHY|nr:hypothetical protein NLI96_g10228 [Physisporinus lineatus]